jgi:serine-type D-Ala-D-Ala carboxypeptidase/endopeptidase (penicillin-binding protein 4)
MRSARILAFCLLNFAFCILNFSACAKPRASAIVPLPPNPVRQLRTDIESAILAPGLYRATWGIAVHSLARNERLFELDPHALLVPASTMKLISLAAAAEAVGWDYTFETQVLATGPIVGGVLQGDLVIVGSGDPSVAGRPGDADLSAWTAALRDRGISRIEGRIVGDDDAADEPRPGFIWSWDDLGYPYGALPGALNFAENVLEITVTPGALEGQPTTLTVPPDSQGPSVVNRSVTGPARSRQMLSPEWRPGERHLTIAGTIAADAKPTRLAVAAGNPTEWYARMVRARLIAAGIGVSGPAVDGDDAGGFDRTSAAAIHTHRSPPLSGIAKPLLQESINVYAEAVLRLATGPSGPRSTDQALDAVRARLESWDIPREAIQIVDGSGLSRRDVIAPDALVAILRRMWDETGASPWMQAVAVAGRSGTLEARMKRTPAEGNLVGKTGSMSNVRTLAGYVRTADGEPLAFAIMVNNFEGPSSAATEAIDRVAVRLATFSRTPRSAR